MKFQNFLGKRKFFRSGHIIWFLVLGAILTSSCATLFSEPKPQTRPDELLRVGITPYYPPLIFKQGDQIKGVDADLARRLAATLGRRAEFIEVSRDQLIPALMRDEVDIVMSGMTITDARKARANFADPYLKVGLVTLMRAEDAAKFSSRASVTGTLSAVAVVQGTTSETFVRNNFPNASNIISIRNANEAPGLLINRRVDLFVHDSPSVIWLVSENEGVLKGYLEPFNAEYLGWAVKRENRDFLEKINSILRTWKKDGTIKEVLTQWLPYWKDQD